MMRHTILKKKLPGTLSNHQIPTSSKANLKDDEFYNHSPSKSTVNNNGNSCITNHCSPVNVSPKKLNFLACDKGGKRNSSNNDSISIIDVESDESVMCFVEPNNKDELVNDDASTLNANALATKITNDDSNDIIINSIPPTQSTNTKHSTAHSHESSLFHALSSNMQSNDNEDDESVTNAGLLLMFQEMFREEDAHECGEEINEKVKSYKTWPTNDANATMLDVNPTTRTGLFLHNMNDEWARPVDAKIADGFTKHPFEEFKLRIDKDVINQPKNLHKTFKYLWSNTKQHPMKYLKHFWILINNSNSIDGGGIIKDFVDNYRSSFCSEFRKEHPNVLLLRDGFLS